MRRTEIMIATPFGKQKRLAYVFGEWAANYCASERRWNVTHLATGLRIPPDHAGELGRFQACSLAERLAAARPDMGEGDKPPRASIDLIKKILGGVLA